MRITEMVGALRIELYDINAADYVWSNDALVRAIHKSVSLMSRLLPKRAAVETTIVRTITGETLTIATNTGTLAYKPIKVGTVVITGKTLDTDYRINYLTGVVTEIGALLPDADYAVSYELDPGMLDIALILPDYIKIDKVDYPVGDSPASNPTFDIVGDFLVPRGSIALVQNKHLRLHYLGRWTAPTETVDGDYPTHLDDAVIIGSIGQALIFKAESHTQASVVCIAAAKTALDAVAAVTIATAPDIDARITSAEAALTAAIARFAQAVTEAAKMDAPLALAATALGKVPTEIVAGKAHLTTGAALANTATRGERVAAVLGEYAQAEAVLAQGYAREAEQDILLANSWEARASRETTIGNSYLNEGIQRLTVVSRLLEKYQQELVGDSHEVSYYRAQLEKATAYQYTARQYLETAGRYLASGQAKINEMLIMLGVKTEFPMQKASSEQRT